MNENRSYGAAVVILFYGILRMRKVRRGLFLSGISEHKINCVFCRRKRMNENRSYGAAVVILFFLYIFILGDLEHMIRERSKASFLSDKYMESPQFRNQKVSVKDYDLYIFILGDLEHMIRERSKASFLSDKYMESPQFRNQKVSVKDYEEIRREGTDNWIGVLLASVAQEGFQGKKTLEMPAKLKQYKPEEYQKISAAYKAIWFF